MVEISPRRPQGSKLSGWQDESVHGSSFDSVNALQNPTLANNIRSPEISQFGQRFVVNEAYFSQKYVNNRGSQEMLRR